MAAKGMYVFVCILLAGSVAVFAEADKTWTIHVGHDWGAQEYIDDGGYLKGFNFDLIQAVCSSAGIKCRTIWDKYENCWDSEAGQHSTGGRGLLQGYYDACTGWAATVGRVQVFDFSMPFLQASKSKFYRKKSSGVTADDVTNLKIGFQDGYMADEKCMARQTDLKGIPIKADKVFHYATTQEMIDAVNGDKVNLLFAIENSLDMDLVEEVPGQAGYGCAIFGHAMMTRKDNDFNAHWNRGFQALMSNGRYAKLCKNAGVDHAQAGVVAPCL